MSALLRLLAAVALVLGLAIAPAAASAQAPPPDITDAAFLAAAAQSNRFEIIAGDLASKRGKHRVVRRLGRQFEKHHTMALADGPKVAAKLGIPVPGGVNAEQAAAIDKLRDLRGRRFDRAWLKAQLLAHEQAVVLASARSAQRRHGRRPDARRPGAARRVGPPRRAARRHRLAPAHPRRPAPWGGAGRRGAGFRSYAVLRWGMRAMPRRGDVAGAPPGADAQEGHEVGRGAETGRRSRGPRRARRRARYPARPRGSHRRGGAGSRGARAGPAGLRCRSRERLG